MIFRRIKAHIEKENWFAVGIDFLIVVLGVFIGLQVANWNEARAERAAAERYLDRIVEDLSLVQTSMQSNLNLAAWVETHMMASIDALSAQSKPDGASFLIDIYVSGYELSGIVPREALTELISSEAFEHIHDADVRAGLKRFNRVAQNAEDSFSYKSGHQSSIRRAMPYAVLMDLRSACSNGNFGTSLEGFVLFTIPDTCPPEFTAQQVEQTIDNILSENVLPELREALAVLQVKESEYEIVKQEAADLQRVLERGSQ